MTKDLQELMNLFWFKRKSFEHEREIRAVYKDFNNEIEYGKAIDIDINFLIENIFVSPTAQSWFVDLVKATLNKYEIKKKVKISSMLIEPFH